jgi:SAM-dependent methyltransferase
VHVVGEVGSARLSRVLTDAPATEALDRSSLEFAVLLEQRWIPTADRALQERGLLDPQPSVGIGRRIARRLLRRPDPALVLKTWDLQRTIAAFTARLEPTDPVLDIGCYACDVLPAMKRLGFGNLSGIDLNPAVTEMPYADVIEYTVGDLLSTPWPDGHFAGISAISVIEHGVPDDGLCREVSRLLRPGGIFVFTTDYWPEKIETSERMFDLDWRIFDAAEIADLVAVARTYDLHPVTDPAPTIRAVREPAIHFSGKDYTFLYGAFVRG